MRSWDGFSAHSGKQQLDEKGGREREDERARAGGESMPSSEEISSCAHSEKLTLTERKRKQDKGRRREGYKDNMIATASSTSV